MAKRSSADVGFLLIDGLNVASDTTQFEDKVEALVEEVDGFSEEWVEYRFTGIKSLEITQEGFYDDGEDRINDVLSGQSGAVRQICYGLNGNNVGQGFVGFEGAVETSYKRIATRGELHKANAEYKGSGQVDEGVILHSYSTEDEDGASAPVDNSKKSDAGGVAYLQVSGMEDCTSATVLINHSADGSSWAPLISFTVVTGAPAFERKVVAGEVKRYLAVAWSFTGAGTSPEIKFFTGFKRNKEEKEE